MKKCPFCAEEIQDEAVFCKHCKNDLKPVEKKNLCPFCGKNPFSPEGKLFLNKKCTKCGKDLPTEVITGEKPKSFPGATIKCPACAYEAPLGKFKSSFSGCLCLVLFCLAVLPGVVYLVLAQGKKRCPNCGKVF